MKPFTFAASILVWGLAASPLLRLAAQPLSMAVTFTPNPPKQGTETIVIQLTDASHRPVNNAKVTVGDKHGRQCR